MWTEKHLAQASCTEITLINNKRERKRPKTGFHKIKPQIALTSNNIDFFLPVYPKERVKVVSKKSYFRFNKLKCKVELFNEKNELVCRGTISGMLKSMNNEA